MKTKPKRKVAKPKKRAAKAKAKAKPKAKPKSIAVNVTLHEPVDVIDRSERYEEPVFEALKRARLGGEGDGGGTLMGRDGEIEEVDFDVNLTSLDGIVVIKRVLETCGAPKGSQMRYTQGKKKVVVPFGITEGVAIYLDGVTQPKEVYQTSSADELLDKLMKALGTGADYRGSWQGPRETALYLYSLDAEKLFTAIEPVLRAYPLSKNARVVIRHGHKSLRPREVRL